MNKFFPSLFLLLLGSLPAFTQSAGTFDETKPANIIPPSPNVAGLFKNIGNSVSYYTGTAQLNIPLWTISAGSVQVPVSLNYSTSSIGVEQEAGFTGLNWTLDAGGVITRSMVGLPDELQTGLAGYRSTATILGMPPVGSDPSSIETWFATAINNSTNAACKADKLSDGKYDLTPDQYFMNFCGHSGKMVFDLNGSPFITPDKPWKVTGDVNTGYRIVTEEGNIYDFTLMETSQGSSESVSSGTASVTSLYNSAWFLTRAITANREDTVLFTYQAVANGITPLIRNETKGIAFQGQTSICGTTSLPSSEYMIPILPAIKRSIPMYCKGSLPVISRWCLYIAVTGRILHRLRVAICRWIL